MSLMDYNTDLKRRNPPHLRLREKQVLILSAQELKNVKHVTKMRAFTVVYVQKDLHVAKTHVDKHDATNPTWSEVVKVRCKEDLPESDIMEALNVDIYAHGHVREKPVGSARVLLRDVLKEGDVEKNKVHGGICVELESYLVCMLDMCQSVMVLLFLRVFMQRLIKLGVFFLVA